ncbi:MAG: 4'-phosphopantetheinyl transferase family protein, partial [Clostridia bacterium]
DRSGRPFLAWPAGFTGDFNASHHGELVGCAVVGSGSVGFDIVDPEEFTDPDLVSILHARERAYFDRLPGGAARTRFLARVWVLKEAYLKMVGTGLGVEPASICFDMEPWPRRLFQLAGGRGNHPGFQVWEPRGAMMAAAVSTGRAALSVHEVPWAELFPAFPADGKNQAGCPGTLVDRVSGVGRKS